MSGPRSILSSRGDGYMSTLVRRLGIIQDYMQKVSVPSTPTHLIGSDWITRLGQKNVLLHRILHRWRH